MTLKTIKIMQNLKGFLSKTDPLELHDEPIHPLNPAFDNRVRATVAALRNGESRKSLLESEGSIVVREAESYLRGEPVLRIRQFGNER